MPGWSGVVSSITPSPAGLSSAQTGITEPGSCITPRNLSKAGERRTQAIYSQERIFPDVSDSSPLAGRSDSVLILRCRIQGFDDFRLGRVQSRTHY